MLKIKLVKFWQDFNYIDNYITYLFRNNNIPYVIHDNDNELDYLIVGSFIHNQNEYDYIKSIPSNVKKILYVSEPLEVLYPFAYKLLCENFFDYVFGSVSNKYDKNGKQIYFKFPMYTMYYTYNDTNSYNTINRNILDINEQDLLSKKQICLVNSHDKYNSRTQMYKSLINNNINIVCPGALFNNASNQELNEVGKVNYIKNFLFNICPENTITKLDGYVTEKILESSAAGCIPIYNGSIDDVDRKIFNFDRVIFFDKDSEESILNATNKIKYLLENKSELVKFYKQPAFCDTAFYTIKNLENTFFNLFR